MKRLLAAFIDELRRLLADPGAMLVLLGAVFIYAAFYPLPYSREVLKDVPISVVDLDRSTASRQLERMLDGHELLASRPEASAGDAERAVEEGRSFAVVVIPRGFQRNLERAALTVVPLHVDTAYFLAYRQVLTGAAEAVGTFSAGVELRRAGLAFSTRAGMREPVRVLFRPVANATESYRQYVVPAVLILVLQQTLLVGIGMLRAGRRGPDNSVQSTMGAALAYLVLYGIHAAIYLTIVFRVYGFEQRGSFATIAVVTSLFLAAVIFLGFSLSALFSRREAAIPALLFTSLPALFLAGFAWPVEAMPPFVRFLASFLPSTHGITAILRATTLGAPLRTLAPQLWWLTGLAAGYFALAVLIARRSSRLPVR